MKYITTTLFLCCYFFSVAQTERKPIKTRQYIPLSSWKKIYKKPLTKQDSMNFVIKGKDTLVMLTSVPRPNGAFVPYEYKDSTFLSYYTKIAFRLKNDSTDKKQTMKYWKQPLRVFITGSFSGKVERDFKKFAKSTINHIDSLQIKFVNKVEDSNFIVYSHEDYDYESKINKKSNSAYYMHWSKSNKITKFAMRINTSHYFSDKLRLMEIKRYFIQSLGYFKTIDEFSCDSYFSLCNSKEKQLTSLDIELLKYHYSYGICKGTDLHTFLDQHKKAKEMLRLNPKNKMNFIHPE
ncbi:DUF2927 domain-containing protein [Psychroserpens luteolus]|uniref:DUF2927 domain-containing protein n=1 Tax=Psychroserpens luteolus TaxID=2855840 RepID=UPI001E5E24E2|nr:DUF2927 domain-containing protein [Psychroserpens luteolus]MCD2259073.1 DUF2927 domain-containing protein [Psychroserpens luteolus]